MVTIHWIDALIRAAMHQKSNRTGRARDWARHDRGEGVISAAIAVLIMAFLGAAMWLGFNRMWKTTENTTNQKVQQIGSDAP